jgi:hypothetical protein
MLPPDPSADPNRTLDHQPIAATPQSDTIDVSQEACPLPIEGAAFFSIARKML